MANIATVWRPATVRTIPTVTISARRSEAVTWSAVVGGLLDAGGDGVRVRRRDAGFGQLAGNREGVNHGEGSWWASVHFAAFRTSTSTSLNS